MRKIIILLTLISGMAATALAQQPQLNEEKPADDSPIPLVSLQHLSPSRPRVGLVLSGGGAKGMAHIGVLKVLERIGIPIDIITGTSMGSIIGGMYACGHRSHELDSVVRHQDWSYVLSDREDLSHQSLHEREKQNTYVITKNITFGRSSGTGGGGFILGKNISTLFDALTAPYHDSIDFSALPIPFACVATNVVDNTEYVFHNGILSQAMRASMSIPGAFAPVRKGDMVLVDGGLRNNFPTDIARQMGADIIIGVDVQSELKTASGLTTTSSILLQIVDINCKNKYEENMRITDIPIRVNTTGYSAASFTKSAIDTLIRRGEEAAMKQWDNLVALRDRLGITKSAPHPRIANVRVPLPNPTKYKIGGIVFENMRKSDQTYIRNKFRLRTGDTITMDRADIITTAIRQDLYYKTARFRIQNNPGRDDATVTFIAGDRRVNQVNVGARFDNEEMVALQANAEFPFKTSTPMDVELTLRLGKRVMARADWSLHPISFFRPTVSYAFRYNEVDYYEYGNKSYSMTYDQHTVKLSLFNFNVRNFNVSIGANWDYYHYRSVLVDRLPEHINETMDRNKGYISYSADVNYNSENEWYFPTRGTRLHAHYAYHTDNLLTLDGHTGMREYSLTARTNIPLTTKLALQGMISGRLLYFDNVPFVMSNMMGGEWYGHTYPQQIPFAGVGNLELSWDKLYALQMQAQYRLTPNNNLLLRFAIGQDGQSVEEMFKSKAMLGGSISYYYNTMFGPLGGSLGYSNLTKKLYFYVNLGFVF